MKKKLSLLFAVLVVTSLLLGACKPATVEAPTEAEEVIEAPEEEKGLIVVGQRITAAKPSGSFFKVSSSSPQKTETAQNRTNKTRIDIFFIYVSLYLKNYLHIGF